MRGSRSYDEDDAWADSDRDADVYARTVLGDGSFGPDDGPIPMDDGANDDDAQHAESSPTIDDESQAQQRVIASGRQGPLAVDTSAQTCNEADENEAVAASSAAAAETGPLIMPSTTAAADGLSHSGSGLTSPLPPIPDMGTSHAADAATGAAADVASVSGLESGKRIGDPSEDEGKSKDEASDDSAEEKKEMIADAAVTAVAGYIDEDENDNSDDDEEEEDLAAPLVPLSDQPPEPTPKPYSRRSDAEGGSLRDIDLSPPTTPTPQHYQPQQHQHPGRRPASAAATATAAAFDRQHQNELHQDPAAIRFGSFLNKQILRARRMFHRGANKTGGAGGGTYDDGIAGTVKIDPATGSLLPVVQHPSTPGGVSGTAAAAAAAATSTTATTHASDLRRRKSRIRQYCERTEYGRSVLRSTLTVMHFLGRVLLWTSMIAMVVMIIYYSHELRQNGTDPHLIAWFSAGAFVLLGFPISIYGILSHLSNYYQPHIQCYVVRILWMVPIYSIESWLCLRFHTYAIYIETLRDCYESFVLYSFFQFLIQVLGGEEQLVLMLKDKSPTRGVHIWGFDWCIRPWLMGQPVSRTYVVAQSEHTDSPGGVGQSSSAAAAGASSRTIKQVRWTSPFLVKCKRGILQYVVLKFVCSLSAMLLEVLGWYHEGSFSPRYGYFYICLLTNFSQCWALYCLVFFYYATKNELGPIRPVGKFLSVKALVFFTWWQSVGISILFQMGMIPHYSFDQDDANLDWTAEDVAKGLQDYLICIEMFGAAVLHMFVFPHTDYLQPIGVGAGSPTTRTYPHGPNGIRRNGRRLGRKGKVLWNGSAYQLNRDDRSVCSKSSSVAPDQFDLELGPIPPASAFAPSISNSGSPQTAPSSDDERGMPPRRSSTGHFARVDEDIAAEENSVQSGVPSEPGTGGDSVAYSQHSKQERKGFVHAFLDSTLPKDVLDESVGYLKGNYAVEKKTLLSHAATSDEYDLFSKRSKRRKPSAASMRRAGDTRQSNDTKSQLPKGMGYPGVPVMKSVKEQD